MKNTVRKSLTGLSSLYRLWANLTVRKEVNSANNKKSRALETLFTTNL